MHHRLARLHTFAHGRPVDASWAEAFRSLRTRARALCGIARPLGSVILALTFFAGTTPGILFSQTFAAPSAPAGVGVSLANILGRIADQSGKPLPNVEVVAKFRNGNVVRTIRTNVIGRYCISDLTIGQYLLTQDPTRAPFDGQTVVTSLPPEGLYVDWRVTGNSAIALATTLRDSTGCPQFLAGDTLLEKIFGVVNSEMLAGGSIAAGLGVAAGAAVGGKKGPSVASPSR